MTMYKTPRGLTETPMTVELYSWTGKALGMVSAFEKMSFVFAEREADTASLTVPLNALTALLVPCDGTVIIVARVNGATHLSVPVDVSVQSADDPTIAQLVVEAAGGWTLLDGEVIPPGLDAGVDAPELEYSLSNFIERVLKTFVTVGSERVEHPIHVIPDDPMHNFGSVTVSGAWETVGEACKNLLQRTGLRLSMEGWAPGDQPLDGISAETPFYSVDVRKYREVEGLVWSAEGGDISQWELKQKRATATRIVVSNQDKDLHLRASHEQTGMESGSPWQRRETFLKVQDPKPLGENEVDPFRVRENLEMKASEALSDYDLPVSVSATITPGGAWEFGRDGKTALQYDVGDIATVVLPHIGEVKQVVTSVEVEWTPESFTITPMVATPDTQDTGLFATVADTTRRVVRLEKRV